MVTPEILLDRLEAIAESISLRPAALALIGLGSVGLELDRLDPFSDLDFFVIVQTGSKGRYLDDLSWLTDLAPVVYFFKNTQDGYKLLYEDGVFCEFAVFEPSELEQAAFAPGRVVWQAPGADKTIAVPQKAIPAPSERTAAWLVGEALTNIYVGLLRELRGEKLSAARFIQGFAVDRILELSEQVFPAMSPRQDPFSLERSYERRYPAMVEVLAELIPGYRSNRAAALAAVNFLDAHFDVNEAMQQMILQLIQQDPQFR